MVNAFIKNFLDDEFPAGTVSLETIPKDFIRNFAKDYPEQAASLFGGKDELDKALNSGFAIDSTTSSISLMDGSDYIPLSWETPLSEQGPKVKELVKKSNSLVFVVNIAMPNA